MNDEMWAQRLDRNWMRELRHVGAMGGWVHATYFDRVVMPSVRDHLVDAGYIEPGRRGPAATYELTEPGWAWCRENAA